MNTQTPPPLRPNETTDLGHLKLLAIFHYVVGAFSILSIGFFALHFLLMRSMFQHPQAWQSGEGVEMSPMPAVPEEFMMIMVVFYLVGGLFSLAAGVLMILSGLYIQKLKNRTFSIVMAAISCAFFPFGTLLGVFTLIKLTTASVKDLYLDPRVSR
ncbi:MAG TPA: hypothetical protein DCX06_04170 [Opitutae bacterium]|nr:hypothetical protein [Opitutae bacterium]